MAGSTVGGGEGVAQTSPPTQQPTRFRRAGPVPAAASQADPGCVATAFDLSYADLTAAQQRLFRRLGLVPGPDFDAHAAAALDGTSLDEARRCLDELYDQHLIGEPVPGRYRLHDLLREHARALADGAGPADRDAAAERLLDYYLHTALAAGQRLPTWDFDDGLRATRPAATVRAAATLQQALELSRDPADLYCQCLVLQELSAVQRLTGDYRAAAATLQQAQAVNRELGDHYEQALILSELGALQRLTGDYWAAIASQQQALEALCDLGEPAAQGFARNELGLAQQETGDYAAAAASHQQALRLLRDAGEPYGQAQLLNSLGELASRTSDTSQARDHHSQALAIAREIGAPLQEARALEGTGNSHLQEANPTDASAHLQQAFAIYLN